MIMDNWGAEIIELDGDSLVIVDVTDVTDGLGYEYIDEWVRSEYPVESTRLVWAEDRHWKHYQLKTS